ncbi:unnamed protein product [Ascophyllum nodosum]
MDNASVKIPGTIRVLRPQNGALPDVRFNFPCRNNQLEVLYQSLRYAASDARVLEELLLGELVPWVRRRLEGKAPCDVCRWLLRLVAGHESSPVVLAAEKALLALLEEAHAEWKLEYKDVQDIWRRCGVVWLDGEASANTVKENEKDGDNDKGRDEVLRQGDITCLKRNLKPALNVIRKCMQRGAHNFSGDELQELMVDFAAAALDKGVNASCVTELYPTVVAVANAMPGGLLDDAQALASLVDALCDPSARALEGLVEPLSFVLLAHNVPYQCHGSSSSLRHEVCHRLLATRFISDTSYVCDDLPRGFERALKALQVLSDNEDDLLEDDSEVGYQRQYAVVALANEMAAGTLVVSQTGKPDAQQSKKMIAAVDKVTGQLLITMQSCVQMSKTMLDLMKTKYAPYLPSSSGRQEKLPFSTLQGGRGKSDCGVGGVDREDESDESAGDDDMTDGVDSDTDGEGKEIEYVSQ